MMNKKGLIILFSVIFLSALPAYSQDRSGRATISVGSSRKISAPVRIQTPGVVIVSHDPVEFKRVSSEISMRIPGIGENILECDKRVIKSAQTEIQKVLGEMGFEKKEANSAALAAWEEVRLNSPLPAGECMDKASFIKYVSTEFVQVMGRMIFRTSPSEADIEVNGLSLNKKTEYKRWYPPDTYRVTYTKDGFLPSRLRCAVRKDEETICFAFLIKP